ncbi:MAG: putative toxin-antitoxin system toxin component, PIN family [Euryarchaeota archaeon]|nr:putative toxin-antitoxin system toxin component, PIN family [Euryarchaeota archaeon]
MRVLIDSNVLVSAIVFDANELKVIFDCMRKGHALVISEHIEEEVLRTMLSKFPEHAKMLHEFLDLGSFETVSKVKYLADIGKHDFVRDKHDRHLLACAINAKCTIIVTGDKDMLVLKSYQGVEIINAKEAIKSL